ncbi:DMT family transporter [Thermithiobacillus plumbiphilus]|uniref:DMT family transporter n=1 Tax=Thermithiobacillus plumbiphilus TaxID=1729899 RepID=A0ABU9DA46_9PROT
MKSANLLKGAGLLLFAAIFWGGLFPVAKSALIALDPYILTAIRYGSTALIFLVLLVWSEGRQALRLETRGLELWLFGSIGFAGFSLFVFAGLGSTTPEHGAVILALMPMITVLFNWGLKGNRPAGFTLATVLMAFVGVFLVVTAGHPRTAFTHAGMQGDLLILMGTVSWVIYTLGAARFQVWSPLRYSALSCAMGTISILAIALAAILLGFSKLPDFATLRHVWSELLYIVVFASVLAVLSWNAGIKMLGSLNGVLFINFVPITAFALGILLGHHFGDAELLGAALTIMALVANNLYLRRKDMSRPLRRAT